MNRISIDIFAETNPAFCSLILFNFCKGYFNETGCGVSFPLLILPLPIILSNDLAKSFEGTNIKTGFFRWLESNPDILIDLSIRINEINIFFKPAIEFGIFKKVFYIDNSGLILPLDKSVKNIKNANLEYLFKSAQRLGSWLGQIDSTKTIYNHLGLQL